jgi:beta-lactamase regulating signal transducer with metallopeptidase domain
MMLALGKHLLESTIFALFVGALTLILRRRGPATRYMLWLLAAATFLLPGETISLLGSKLAELLPVSHVSQPLPMLLASWVTPSTISVPPQTANTDVLNYVLLLVWLLGCVLMLVAWLPKLWRAPEFSDSRDSSLLEYLQRLQQRIGLRQAVTLRFSDSIAEPVLVGFRKPIVVLPTGLAGKLSSPELESVVLHELAHAKRKDNWTAALAHVVTCTFWFYPLLWWIEQRLHRERELACDEMVVCYGADSRDYVAGILKVCRLQLTENVAGVSGVCRSNLKDRMEAIMSFSAERMSRPAPKTLLGGLVAAVFLVPILIGFFFAPARSAARVLDQPPFTGTWEGKLQNLPGVDLKIDETGGNVTGTVVFYLLGRSKANGPAHESGQKYSVPLLVPHVDGKILTFEVQRKKCEGCTELGPNAKFRMELTGQNEARLWNLTENSKGPGLELVRSTDTYGQDQLDGATLPPDQASVIGRLRSIGTAEWYYNSHYPGGFSPTLASLGIPPKGVKPSASAAALLTNSLTSGTTGGYIYTYTPGPKDSSGKIATYTVTARPVAWKKGMHSFFTDQTRVVRWTGQDRAPTARDAAIS